MKTTEETNDLKTSDLNWAELWNRYGVISILIIYLIAASLLVPHFFELSNFVNVIRNMAFVSFVAYGQTLVILSGGLDLSHGSLVSLSCMAAAALAAVGYPWVGVIAALLVGCGCGLTSGAIIGFLRLNPIIATLGMMYLAGGLSSYFTDGKSIDTIRYEDVKILHYIADGNICHIPIIFILSLIALAITFFLLRFRAFGNKVYALGGDTEKAEVVGVDYIKMKIAIFAISGFSCGITGALFMGRTCSGEAKVGFGTFILESVGAVVIGGNNIFGGRGNIGRTFLGLLTLAFLNNSLNLYGFSTYMQEIIIGIVVLVFCYLSMLRRT